MSLRLALRSPARVFTGTALALLLAGYTLGGCGQTVELGVDDPLTTGGGAVGGAVQLAGSANLAGEVTGQGGSVSCVATKCRDQEYECGNCTDDDQDGLIDARDPDCLGPCDDDESGLSTGMEGNNGAACRQDCYFDGDAGPGNDHCQWSHVCDPRSVAPDYPPSGEMRCEYDAAAQIGASDCTTLLSAQPASCLDNCLPLVPNGCDCFGCCELADGKYHFVGKGRGELGCQRDALDDAEACPLCTQVDSCLNPCDECETCVGKLPDPGCSEGSGCPAGQAACDGSSEPCDFAEYCVTGCCVRAPEPI